MSSREVIQTICAELGSVLRPEGFRRRAYTFTRQGEQVASLVDVRRLPAHRARTVDVFMCDVHYGVAILELIGRELNRMPGPLGTADLHWSHRLESDEQPDGWWVIESVEDAPLVARRIALSIQERVLPALAKVQTKEAIMNFWLAGGNAYLSIPRRTVCLGYLLAQASRWDELDKLRAAAEGSIFDDESLAWALKKLDEFRADRAP